MEKDKPFLADFILAETNLVCAFARAKQLLDSDEFLYETRGQARSFLMEIYGKLESIKTKQGKDGEWHANHLQTIVHLLQGSLSLNLAEFPNAENELKVMASDLCYYLLELF